MKNKIILFLILCIIFIPSSKAATKDDLYNLVDSQTVCDSNTSTLFEKYKIYYKRIVKTKELTAKELDQIINNINYVLNIINQKGICKVSDLKKLSLTEKTNVYNALMAGTKIINNAPNITGEESNDKKDNDIVVNPSDKTVSIYDGGKLTEKITLDTPKLTYTGPDMYISVLLITVFIFLSIPFIYVFASNSLVGKIIKKYRAEYNSILYSVSMIFIVVTVGYLTINKNRELFSNISVVFKEKIISETKENNQQIILNEDKVIMNYPAIGDNYATLSIASLGIDNEVSFGDEQTLLKNFIGHNTGSYLPGEGGTIIYSGHNSSKFLLNLKNVIKGDLITIETTYGVFKYKVDETKVIKDTDFSSIKVVDSKESLILYTCYPFDSILYSNQRLALYADLVETVWKED